LGGKGSGVGMSGGERKEIGRKEIEGRFIIIIMVGNNTY
jgi:hypothetical protein